jgi:hypothetical protein
MTFSRKINIFFRLFARITEICIISKAYPMRKCFIFLIVFLTMSQVVYSQRFYSRGGDRKFIAQGGLGISSYYGDLNNPGDIIDFTPGVNLGMRYLRGDRYSVGGNLNWFMLSGDDAKANDPGREVRNLSFRSHNIELIGLGYVDLFPRLPRFYQRADYNPYFFAGLGLTYFNPRAKYQGQWHALRPLRTEGVKYSSFTFVIPMGLGVRYRINPFFNVALEGGYRFAFTDYLDDVSTFYKDPNTFSDPIARALADRREEIGLPRWEPGKKRGDPSNNDGYFLFHAKVEYYIDELFGPDRWGRTIRRRRR